jgi:hypothetical protein
MQQHVSSTLELLAIIPRRAMELAVALSKYVGEAEPLPLISEFCDG